MSEMRASAQTCARDCHDCTAHRHAAQTLLPLWPRGVRLAVVIEMGTQQDSTTTSTQVVEAKNVETQSQS